MMNCGQSVFKRTNIDRLMNALIIGVSTHTLYISFLLGLVVSALASHQLYEDLGPYLPAF